MTPTDVAVPVVRELTAAEIRWVGSDPVARLEEIDPLGLSDGELLAHIEALRAELRAVRLTLHQAIAELARGADERVALAHTIERLRQERPRA